MTAPRARVSLAAGAVAVAVLLGSCAGAGVNRIGISRNGPNGVRIHFLACPQERVTRVALLGNAESVGFEIGNDEPADDPDSDEYVIWEIANPAGSDGGFFDVGATPPGWSEVAAIDGPASSYGGLAAFIGFDRNGLRSVQLAFDVEDLEPGTIYSSHRAVPPAEFEERASADCES